MRNLSWKKKGSRGEIYACIIKVIDEKKLIYFIDCTCYNFVNRRIEKVGQFSDIRYFANPCKHLKPVVDALIKQGYILKSPKPMTGTDKCTTILRKCLVERSNGLCEACGRPGHEIHRKCSKTNGGKYNESNCVLLCSECHKMLTYQKWQGTPGAKK